MITSINNKEDKEINWSNNVGDDISTKNKFSIDYSIRGTAKCKVCKAAIAKDELRIGTLVQYQTTYYIQYRHVQCAFRAFRRARVADNIIMNASDIDGIEKISLEDQSKIKILIGKENLERRALPEKKTRKKSNRVLINCPAESRQKLMPSNLPEIPVLFTNADQLTSSKMSELQVHVTKEKPLIVAICEVKPKNRAEVDLLDFALADYTLHPTNLDNGTEIGRGIAVYTHKTIEKSVIDVKPTTPFNESCLLEIKLKGRDRLLFGCIYRSPTISSTSKVNNERLNKLFLEISESNYSHICLVGDFNFRDINWETCSTIHNEESKEYKFIETIQSCFLHQHMTKHTRRRGNDVPSLIDLVFTNEIMQISDIKNLPPLGRSDHDVISFKFHSYLDFSKPKSSYLFRNGDYPAMKELLKNECWREDFLANSDNKSVEGLWRDFKSKILSLRDKFVPIKTTTGNPTWKSKGSVPIDAPTRIAIKEKKTLHHRWSKANKVCDATEHRKNYLKATNKVKRLMRKAKRNFERDIANKSKSNPKAFWSFIRNKLKTKAGVGPLLANDKDKTTVCFDDKGKANILQEQFCSVFTLEPDGSLPPFSERTDANLMDITLTEDLIRTELLSLNVNKASGPDDVHPRILLELADELSAPLALLFQKTLRDGIIPSDWKKATVSPIYKKGQKNKAENYRPISLTSIVCKIMEKLLKDSIMQHLVDNSLLSSKQFGFLFGRSTVTQLLRFLDDCLDKTVNGGVVDTIYMDFAKAFDKVPHKRLLHKLKAYGIKGNILGWIEAFLTDREQVVQVNGEKSDIAPVHSGVPQGSVLGPILFIIYINDLPEHVKSTIYLFADDTKIAHQVSSAEDSQQLIDDLNELSKWSSTWLLEFNVDKCHVLTIGRLENITHTERYQLNGTELEHVFEEKDLGVIIDSNLTFEQHISQKVMKANAIMGSIRRAFTFLDKNLFRKLFVTFVRPHLEYAQSVWAPHSAKHVNMIESVQQRATRLVNDFKNIEYSDRLRLLDLPTLAHRRARGDMIEIWKHFNVYDKSSLGQAFKPRTRIIRSKTMQLLNNKSKDGVRGPQRNSFYHRTVDVWNKLPEKVKVSKTINEFKNNLDNEWNDIPSKYGSTESGF